MVSFTCSWTCTQSKSLQNWPINDLWNQPILIRKSERTGIQTMDVIGRGSVGWSHESQDGNLTRLTQFCLLDNEVLVPAGTSRVQWSQLTHAQYTCKIQQPEALRTYFYIYMLYQRGWGFEDLKWSETRNKNKALSEVTMFDLVWLMIRPWWHDMYIFSITGVLWQFSINVTFHQAMGVSCGSAG